MSHRLEQDSALLQAFAWSESIIADVLHRHYSGSAEGGASRDRLHRLHRYFWKALIFESEALRHRQQRRRLIAAAREAGIDLDFLASVDDDVVVELLEVVLQRFRAAPREARDYHLLLMSVAARLRISALIDFASAFPDRPGSPDRQEYAPIQ